MLSTGTVSNVKTQWTQCVVCFILLTIRYWSELYLFLLKGVSRDAETLAVMLGSYHLHF